jgi:hypothetical protein
MGPRAWTGSRTESPVQTVPLAPSAARLRGIRAASAPGAPGRTSHNPPVVGSSPTRPTSGLIPVVGEPWTGLYTDVGGAMFEPSGRIWSHRVAAERVWRIKAYGWKDRTGCLRGSPRVCRTGQRVLPPAG